ncbi:hypothetical protein LCGC14_0322770 [marine sediment metagenome]|uniref:Uncharacterized protein n=1 Tax=marine sediment metagenome TaxID=412755 RepID=A0A0F9WQP1_9ZZZZ
MSLCRPGCCQSARKTGAAWIDRTLANLCVSERLRRKLIDQASLFLLNGFSAADLNVRVSCGGRAEVVGLVGVALRIVPLSILSGGE